MVTRIPVLFALAILVSLSGPYSQGQTKQQAPPKTREQRKPKPVPERVPVVREPLRARDSVALPRPDARPVRPDTSVRPHTPVRPYMPVRLHTPARRISVSLLGGAGIPMAKDSLTDIWRYGPNFALEFRTEINRSFSIGAGVDLTVLRWSYAGYYTKYPGAPPPLDRKVIWWDLYLLGRYTVLPGSAVTPYLTLKLGATRPTPASFRQVIDSVRVTYYSVAGRTRLSAGGAAGVEVLITDELAFVAEANAVLVHNDPVLGAALAFRAGFRWTW